MAIAVHIFHLVPQWQQALAEVRRVLKPDGIFLWTHGRLAPESPDNPGFNPNRYAFSRQWRSLLAAQGVEMKFYGAEDRDVLDTLTSQGAQLETVIAAQWQTRQTVGELLDRYCQRMYGSCWQISDQAFNQAIAQLTEWCHDYFDSLEADLSHEERFKIVVAKPWAAEG